MKATDTFKNIKDIEKAIVEEYECMGCYNTRFVNCTDGVNLISAIYTTDLNGEKLEGHIYKSFDKHLNPCFIARFYDN